MPRKLAWLWGLAVGLLALGLWSRAPALASFRAPDAYDYAQMGRAVHLGRGLSTQQIFPRHVPFLEERGLLDGTSWPNLSRYPLPPLLHAAAQMGTDNPFRAGQMVSGLFFAVAMGLLAVTAARGFGVVGGLAATLLAFSDPDWLHSAHQALTEPLACACLLGFLGVVVGVEVGAWGWRRSLALGLVSGIAVLTRTQLGFLVPVGALTCALLTAKGLRLRHEGCFFLGLFLSVLPWMVRNLSLVGSPWFSFSSTRNLVMGTGRDLDMELSAPVGLSAVWEQHGSAIGTKILEQLGAGITAEYWGSMYAGLPLWVAVGAALFTLLGILPRFRAPRRLASLITSILALNFFTVSLAFPLDRFFLPTRPLLCLMAAGCLATLIRLITAHSPWVRRGVAALALGALAIPAFQAVARHQESPRRVASLEGVLEVCEPGSVIASDLSHRIALETPHRALRLPANPEELLEIDQEYLRLDYVLLSAKLMTGAKTKKEAHFNAFETYRKFVRSSEFRSRYEEVPDLPGNTTLFRRR